MVDNFEIIKEFITTQNLLKEKEDFLFLQVIQRKKDFEPGQVRLGRNNNNRLIKPYYIYSLEQLDSYKEEIIKLCQLFNARAGINLNKRNSKDVAIKCLEILAIAMRKNDEFTGVSKIYSSACGKESSGDGYWLVDLDREDLPNIENIKKAIFDVEPTSVNKIICEIPTKSGIHLITKRFNRQKFSEFYPTISIHTNNPVNLFIP